MKFGQVGVAVKIDTEGDPQVPVRVGGVGSTKGNTTVCSLFNIAEFTLERRSLGGVTSVQEGCTG